MSGAEWGGGGDNLEEISTSMAWCGRGGEDDDEDDEI
jgi:hypothetical protein